MLISEQFYVFRTTTQSLEKRQSMMPLIFEFPKHFGLFYVHARTMTSYDEPWRTLAGNHRLNQIDALQVIRGRRHGDLTTHVGFMKQHSNYLVAIQRRVDPIRWTRAWL